MIAVMNESYPYLEKLERFAYIDRLQLVQDQTQRSTLDYIIIQP